MGQRKTNSGVDYGIVGLNMSDIRRFIESTFLGGIKRGRRPKPIMIWGPPGGGKTYTVYDAVRRLSERLKMEVKAYNVACSCLEPTDVQGVPSPVEIDGQTRYTSYLPDFKFWLCSKEYEELEQKYNPKFEAPPAILFFDDTPAAHFQTQTAFFKGIQEGMWGDLRQRDNVMVVACGNRAEDNAGANDMPTPLANRFRHCYAAPTTKDWLAWAESDGGGIHPFVIGYIRQNEDDLNEFDEDVANRSEKAFASARTWEDVSELLWEGEINSSDDRLFTKAVMGIIGRGVATKFNAYMRNTNAVVPPAEIVKNPKKARIPSRKNLDALHATISSLEHHLKQNPEHWEAGVRYALREQMPPDVGLLLARTCAIMVVQRLPENKREAAIGSDMFIELFDKYEEVLNAVKL